MSSNNKPIIVSGAHRSGTTWVGKVISQCKGVAYIHEPFNKGLHSSPFPNWFYYIDVNSDDLNYIKYMKCFIDYDFLSFVRYLSLIKTKRQFYYYIQKIINGIKGEHIALLKDPIALFSLPWLSEKFNTRNIILIRHPAAFIASLKLKKWHTDMSNFLEQEFLMETVLKSFKTEIVNFSKKKRSIIDEGILLWRIFHSVIRDYQENYSSWVFIKHEDLSLNAEKEFRIIFNKLGLDFSEEVNNYIVSTTGNSNAKDVKHTGSKVNNVLRNSKDNITYWKERLTRDEILYIKDMVNDVSEYFYDEDEW